MSMDKSVVAERKKRILVLLWAYAYEELNISLVSDHTFDKMCLSVDLSVDTGHPVMDDWFRQYFSPYTGMWIHSLPHDEKEKLKFLYRSLHGGKG